MKSENHNKLYGRPIRLAGYGCPQCLRPFESQEACTGHMEEQEHTKYAFPFKGIKLNSGIDKKLHVTKSDPPFFEGKSIQNFQLN